MISLATLAMIGWIPLILVAFSLLPARRAVIAAYVVGWMFLPILSWDLPGLPQYDKITATNLGVLAAVLVFDLQRLVRLRPGAVDLPILLFCLSPFGTSMANGLGVYDGLAGVWLQVVSWAIPWVIGRCYFSNLEALRELAWGMFLGAVAYVPLCLFEMAFGAILHLKVYGYYQHDPNQTVRLDGSVRPMVFMQHGLALSIWMGTCALAGLAVAIERRTSRLPRSARLALALALVATTLLSRSIGASVLMLGGIAAWQLARRMSTLLPVAALLVAIPGYMTLRSSGLLDVTDLTGFLASGLEASGLQADEAGARLQSARVRFESEDRLFERARDRPVFGASGYAFNEFVDRDTGELVNVTTDGFWTILLATRGLFGLGAWTALMLLPVLAFLRRHPPRAWRVEIVAIGGALALVLLLYTADCLMNANINPLFTLVAGGMVGLPALRMRPRPPAPASVAATRAQRAGA